MQSRLALPLITLRHMGVYNDMTLTNSLNVEGVPTVQAPPVAPANQGRIYFNSDDDKFKVSENGGAYTDLGGGGGGGAFWAANGNHIYNTNTGNVGIGTNDPGLNKVLVNGTLKVNGKLALLSPSYNCTSAQPGIVFGHCFGIQKSNAYSGFHRLGTWPTGSYTVFSSGMSDVMTLTDAGQVGIMTTSPTATLHVNGSLSKTSGSFEIPHPDPAKEAQGWKLRHSFVESPTRGDNLYRWVVEVEHGTATIELPEYFPYLNEDVQVWVSPVKHFGMAYGEVNPKLTKIALAADTDGLYNVLVVGTRKDRYAKEWFDESGVEFQVIAKELKAEE